MMISNGHHLIVLLGLNDCATAIGKFKNPQHQHIVNPRNILGTNLLDGFYNFIHNKYKHA